MKIAQRKAPVMPKPKWRAPWKLYRVISGHIGWVRCVDFEPGNEWFVTGSNDRLIIIRILFLKPIKMYQNLGFCEWQTEADSNWSYF